MAWHGSRGGCWLWLPEAVGGSPSKSGSSSSSGSGVARPLILGRPTAQLFYTPTCLHLCPALAFAKLPAPVPCPYLCPCSFVYDSPMPLGRLVRQVADRAQVGPAFVVCGL